LANEQLETQTIDPLTKALLPVLIHRANNTTQLLANLNTLAASMPTMHWLEERADDLAEASANLEQAGYLLAVLASASGANLLLDRREPRALQIMGEAVRDLMRREGHSFTMPPQPLPSCSGDVAHGWELPWAFGALLAASTRSLVPGQILAWQVLSEEESWVLVADATPQDDLEDLGTLLEKRLPEARLDVRKEGWSWRVPRAWLESAS